MAEQCQATNGDGEPCEVSPGEYDYCHIHRNDRNSRQRGGARTKYSETRAKKVLNELERSGLLGEAAKSAGVSPSCLRDWRDRHDDFSRKVDEAYSGTVVEMASCIVKAAQSGEWRAAAWFLENVAGVTISEGEDGAGQLTEDDAEAIRRAFFGGTGTDG